MISADRRETLQLIEDAVAAGAQRAQACAELGLSLRSLQRWQHCRRIGVLRHSELSRPTS